MQNKGVTIYNDCVIVILHIFLIICRFLFKNHKGFIRMQENGELEMSEDALRVLESQEDLAEVFDDGNGDDDDDDDNDDDKDKDKEDDDKDAGVNQPEMISGFSSTDVFTFDKFPGLYLKSKEFLKIKQGGRIELIDDTASRRPVYNIDSTMAFPYLYATSDQSPAEMDDYKMAKYLIRKQTEFAQTTSEGKLRWVYNEDDTHMMYQYAKLVEHMVSAKTFWFLQETPEVAHMSMDQVIAAFKNGFADDDLALDTKLPGLAAFMMSMPNSR